MRGQIPKYDGSALINTRMSAELVANSGSMASGAESGDIVVSHRMGLVPSVVAGHLEDGSWSHECGWRLAGRDSTNVVFRFRNNGPNTAIAILRFRLIF